MPDNPRESPLWPAGNSGAIAHLSLLQDLRLYSRTAQAIRNGSYGLGDAYELQAPPLSLTSFISALASWSIYPVYLGLILTYAVAVVTVWLAVLTAVTKG